MTPIPAISDTPTTPATSDTPDLREELLALRRAGLEAGAELERLASRLAASAPPSVRELHDTKAQLAYLRLMLRTVQEEAAALTPGRRG